MSGGWFLHAQPVRSLWEERAETLDSLAAELVQLRPDAIVTVATASSLAAKRATTTIPIVMATVGDPGAIIALMSNAPFAPRTFCVRPGSASYPLHHQLMLLRYLAEIRRKSRPTMGVLPGLACASILNTTSCPS
jgi:hypothetical protein